MAVAGGPTSSPNTSSVPMAWKLATMLSATSASRDGLCQRGAHAEGLGFRSVECQREEGPVHHDGNDQNYHRGPRLRADVGGGDAKDIAEEQRGDLGRERTGARHDHDAECQHADEKQADCGVLTDRRSQRHGRDEATHDDGCHKRTNDRTEAPEHRERNPWDHAVGQGVTQKGQPPQDYPGTNNRGGDDSDQAAEERSLHERRLKRFGEKLDHTIMMPRRQRFAPR